MANGEERTVSFGGAVTTSNSRPLLLGHRGARRVRKSWVPQVSRSSRPGYSNSECAPVPAENSIAAFDYALANGCDGFEFDVRYTRDCRALICHDPEFNGKTVAAAEHVELDCLTCLEDVLARFAATAYLDVELKVAGNEEAVVSALRARPPRRGYIVSSFLPEVLLRLHEIDPSLPLGYICKDAEVVRRWTELPVSTFIPHHSLVSQVLVDEVHARNLQLLTWTVNHRRDLLRFAAWGVDGLISDDPKLLAETFPAMLAAHSG